MTRKQAKVRVLHPSLQKDTAASPFRFTGKMPDMREHSAIRHPLTAPRQFDILQSGPGGDRMQFDELRRARSSRCSAALRPRSPRSGHCPRQLEFSPTYRAAWTSSTYGAKSLHRLSDRFGDSCSEGWRREHLLFSAINDHSRLKKHGAYVIHIAPRYDQRHHK